MEAIINAFGIDVHLIIVQIINFTILMVALGYFLYTPVLNLLREREEKITAGIRDAEAAAVAKASAEAEKAVVLTEAHHAAAEVNNRAKAAAEVTGAEIVAAAEAVAQAAKAKAVESIRNLKTALSNLESEFRTKTVLQKYLPTIQGITDLVAQSEDSAIAGHFVAAKEPLRQTSKKLTDTLAVLPVSPPQ